MGDIVQISASLTDLLQRISSYQRYKRFQLDISNQMEFCHSESAITCARTDAKFKRLTKRSVPDTYTIAAGPLGKPLPPLELFRRSLHHERASTGDIRNTRSSSNADLLHLPKRISNIEQYLGLNQGSNTSKDLLTRVAQLEMKLLSIEGNSCEYEHAKIGHKSLPVTNKITNT